MFKSLLAFGTAAGLVLAATAASAGTCSTEIESLQKRLSSTDAGMGPTGTDNMGNVGAMGTVTETGKTHPPTATMNQATEGKAASSEDVLSQNQGAPTDSDAAAADPSGSAGGAAEASDALQRARQFDQAGNETACMSEIAKAKAQLGAQ
ncbi:MAG TPA: hypothetical protein VFG64_09400 [Dongiaceae bacterium]|nr:hypothetical protein [Dongiaceae bacterium]